MPLRAFHLRPKSSQSGRLPPSPTVWGALMWAAATLHGDDAMSEIAGRLPEHPAFVASGAFPLLFGADGRRALRFYPRPELAEPAREAPSDSGTGGLDAKQEATVRAGQQKTLNGVQYVSKGLFERLAGDVWGQQELFERSQQGQLARAGRCLALREEAEQMAWPERLWQRTGVTRVQMDRRTDSAAEGQLFQTVEWFPQPHAGLWVLVDEADDSPADAAALLRYLGDTGLGGKRSVGKGHFDAEEQPDAALPAVEDPNGWVALGHYLPGDDEQQALTAGEHPPEGLRYTLANWNAAYDRARPDASGPVRKPLRRMLAPGSTIPLPDAEAAPASWYGRAVPSGTSGAHTVYVSGLAPAAPARL